jgi:hypothetical protein
MSFLARIIHRLGVKPAVRMAPKHAFRPSFDVLEDRSLPAVGLGAAASFGVLGINGGLVNLNNSSITGDIGLAPRETSSLRRGADTGTLVVDPSARAQLNNSFTVSGGVVQQSLDQAALDAASASSAYAALAPTQVLGNVTSSLTVTGNGGTNVISMTSLSYNRATLTLNGSAMDVFVFNVSGGFRFFQSQIQLSGGVTANHVLFNFPTRGTAVTFSGASDVVDGTFLAPFRTVSDLNGSVVNGAIVARSVSIGSGGNLDFAGFSLPVAASPASVSGFAFGSGSSVPMANVTLTLTGTTVSGQKVTLTTTSAADGSYSFADLQPGTYTITETPPASYIASGTAGTVGGTRDGTAQGASVVNVVLASGNNGVNYDFFNVVPAM